MYKQVHDTDTYVLSSATDLPSSVRKELLDNPANRLRRRPHLLLTRRRERETEEAVALGSRHELLMRQESEHLPRLSVDRGGRLGQRLAELGLPKGPGQRHGRARRTGGTYSTEHGSRSDEDVSFGDLLPELGDESASRVLRVRRMVREVHAEPDYRHEGLSATDQGTQKQSTHRTFHLVARRSSTASCLPC